MFGNKSKSNKSTEIDVSSIVEKSFKALPDKELCELTGFTGKEKKTILESWKLATKEVHGCQTFGVNLFLWMLENVPHAKDRFRASQTALLDKDNMLNEKFLEHAHKVVKELGDIIGLLPLPDRMLVRITKMADVHLMDQTPKIGIEYFGPFRDKFHLFISKCLGLREESATVKLWSRLMGVIASMVEYEEIQMELEGDVGAGLRRFRDHGDLVKKKKLCCAIM